VATTAHGESAPLSAPKFTVELPLSSGCGTLTTSAGPPSTLTEIVRTRGEARVGRLLHHQVSIAAPGPAEP